MSSYKFSKEDCKKWIESTNKFINPQTGRKLKEDSVVLKELKKQCEKYKDSDIKDTKSPEIKKKSPKKDRVIVKSILEERLSKDECLKWQNDKTRNPRTNILIEKNGKLYNKIEEQCKIFLEKKKEKSPEITKEEIKSTNIQSRITILNFIKELKKY